MNVNFGLAGKTAVITGGAGVLGSEIAKDLALNGVKVAILGHSGDKAQILADEINRDGGIAIAYNADVLSKESLISARNFVKETLEAETLRI